ncbi:MULTISPECIES: hypothetical protein [unclassified Microcoleus]|uniref:hypothetical protein n=1 Tax=unclassified Microcoleus TaxID=2642155 RepID=UPI002FD2512B
MTPEPKKFLDDIAAEMKTQPAFNDRESLFFPLRFDKNRPFAVQHKEIAENLMPKDPLLGGVNYVSSIGTTVQNIVSAMVGRLETEHKKAISGLYEAEMRTDGVDVDSLLNGKKGEKGTWEVVYDWLWHHKYLRWLDKNGWQILQEKAKSPPNWLQFLTKQEMASVQRGTRALILPPPPPAVQKTTPTIPVEQSLWMVIDLEFDNSQLLLLNRSQDGQALLCPSSAYAPHPIVDKSPILLPQNDAWAGNREEKFVFGEAGKEEFLAIVLEKPLSLPWLTPREDESLPEWNAERIKELFEQLEKQGNWQVFYQNFDVV